MKILASMCRLFCFSNASWRDPEYENLIKKMRADSMRAFICISIIMLLAAMAGVLFAMVLSVLFL